MFKFTDNEGLKKELKKEKNFFKITKKNQKKTPYSLEKKKKYKTFCDHEKRKGER